MHAHAKIHAIILRLYCNLEYKADVLWMKPPGSLEATTSAAPGTTAGELCEEPGGKLPRGACSERKSNRTLLSIINSSDDERAHAHTHTTPPLPHFTSGQEREALSISSAHLYTLPHTYKTEKFSAWTPARHHVQGQCLRLSLPSGGQPGRRLIQHVHRAARSVSDERGVIYLVDR